MYLRTIFVSMLAETLLFLTPNDETDYWAHPHKGCRRRSDAEEHLTGSYTVCHYPVCLDIAAGSMDLLKY